MRLSTPVAQATFCLALAFPVLTSQTAAQNFPQAVAESQSWIGLGIVNVTPERAQALGLEARYGVEVAQVAPNGPAQQAGIERGDIITQFGTERVRGAEHIARLVRETPPERAVSIECWRGDQKLNIEVVIQRRDGMTSAERDKRLKPQTRGSGFDVSRPVAVVHNSSLGVEIEPLRGQFAQFFGVESGVLVRLVDADSPAAQVGIASGDVIIAVGAGAIRYPKDMRREMQSADSPIKLVIVRNRRQRTVTLPASKSNDNPWPLSSHPEQ
jgi:serine protease Do